MNKLIIYTLILYGFGHYLYMYNPLKYLKNISGKKRNQLSIICEVSDEDSEEGTIECIKENIDVGKNSKDKVLFLLDAYINEINNNTFNDVLIEAHIDIFSRLLIELKDDKNLDNLVGIYNYELFLLRRIFLYWKTKCNGDLSKIISPVEEYDTYEQLNLDNVPISTRS